MSKLADIETSIYLDDDNVDGNALIGEKEGTANDVKDMRRMGKQQQLRVSLTPSTCSSAKADPTCPAAQLWLPLHLRLLHDSDEYLGKSIGVSLRHAAAGKVTLADHDIG